MSPRPGRQSPRPRARTGSPPFSENKPHPLGHHQGLHNPQGNTKTRKITRINISKLAILLIIMIIIIMTMMMTIIVIIMIIIVITIINIS